MPKRILVLAVVAVVVEVELEEPPIEALALKPPRKAPAAPPVKLPKARVA